MLYLNVNKYLNGQSNTKKNVTLSILNINEYLNGNKYERNFF